jgi:hypothetical protein
VILGARGDVSVSDWRRQEGIGSDDAGGEIGGNWAYGLESSLIASVSGDASKSSVDNGSVAYCPSA